MFFNPFGHKNNGTEYTNTQNRIASKLQSPLLLDQYHTTDLYNDLAEIGMKVSLDRSDVNELLHSLGNLIDAPSRIKDILNPFYSMQKRIIMAENLGRYALVVDDMFTAYYAAEYCFRIPRMHTEVSSEIIQNALHRWDGWVREVISE